MAKKRKFPRRNKNLLYAENSIWLVHVDAIAGSSLSLKVSKEQDPSYEGLQETESLRFMKNAPSHQRPNNQIKYTHPRYLDYDFNKDDGNKRIRWIFFIVLLERTYPSRDVNNREQKAILSSNEREKRPHVTHRAIQ